MSNEHDDNRETENKIEINPPNRFLPSYIFKQLPGIDPQVKRSFYLKSKNLVPVSFLNVVLIFSVRLAICTVFFTIIRVRFWQLILEHAIGIAAFILFGSLVYGVYQWAITKNAPDLKEELTLNSLLNYSAIFLSLWIVASSTI